MGLEKVKRSKLLLMGLAVSGKTTITKYMLENRIPSKDDDFNATIDYDKYNLTLGNKEIINYDLGGGTSFLDRFTGELAELFPVRRKLFYSRENE